VVLAEATALLGAPSCDVFLLDARRDLVKARALCRPIDTTGKESPLLVVASEGGLTALSRDWGFDDILLTTAGPAEVDLRIRLATSQSASTTGEPPIQTGSVLIDQASYSATVNGVHLDLTYTEFELFRYLAQATRPGVQPPAAAHRRLGPQRLRRHPHRRRTRPPTPREARPRVRVGDRHRPQRRLPLHHPDLRQATEPTPAR
jgi:hypothetical protein